MANCPISNLNLSGGIRGLAGRILMRSPVSDPLQAQRGHDTGASAARL